MKTALVVGCAECVWRDVEAAEDLCTFDAVYCVKLAGVYWPRKFDVWATLHPEWMADYVAKRKARNLPNGFQTVAPAFPDISEVHKDHPVDRRVSYRFPGMSGSASSGIYGAKVALDDGFERVVLAGIPMTQTLAMREHPKFGRQPWVELGSFTAGFKEATPRLLGCVTSMSGLTRDILGAPSPEWLAG